MTARKLTALMANAANIGGEITHPEILGPGQKPAAAVGALAPASLRSAAIRYYQFHHPNAWPILEALHFIGLSLLFGVVLVIFAYAAFFVVFMASVMYLLQERELRLKTFSAIFHRLPPLGTINELATNAAIVGLTLLTLGIATGMFWSWDRYGRFWHNDPKEIFALLTWLVYFVLIIYRLTANWRGSRAAWLGVVGFALVLCTLFGARFLGGYHVFGLIL